MILVVGVAEKVPCKSPAHSGNLTPITVLLE
jgi:hypothetical protein